MAATPIAVATRIVLYNPQFPVVGIAMLRTLLMLMLIPGSTAAGKVFPPHIQFQSKAKRIDTARINIDGAEHMQHVLGKFGRKEVKPWPNKFGMNKKGGIDNEEFAKYMRVSIAPLFPNPFNLSRAIASCSRLTVGPAG
jgi:hypothetical protein